MIFMSFLKNAGRIILPLILNAVIVNKLHQVFIFSFELNKVVL